MCYYDIAAFFKNMSEYTNTMSVLALRDCAPALLSSFAGRRPAHHASPRLAALADPSLRARIHPSQPLKTKKAT